MTASRRGMFPGGLAALCAALALGSGFPLAAPGEARAASRYDRFVQGFWPAAKRAGISRATYDAAFQGLTPDPEVIEKDAYQPEFVLPASQYMVLTVTDTRIRIGKEKLEQYKEALDGIEKKYGVDRHVLIAIWGMETNFGTFMGDKKVIRSLSTLAYTGRRRRFGRTQLLAALRMLERGYISADRMTGSWAGAMGHTQLIPSNYLKFAVDFTGDGKRDIWETPPDALASTANYLARNGWTTGRTWGYEVVLPKRFNARLEGRRHARSLKRWAALGVRRVRGQQFPREADRAYLYLPAGAKGPAFLLLDNFRVIMRYNAAHKYAHSVAHLADRFRGLPAFETPWPDGVRALTEEERKELQTLLAARGYEIGKIDGVLGSKTRAAIRAYQKEKDLKPADGFPTPKILELLRAESSKRPEGEGPQKGQWTPDAKPPGAAPR